VCLAGYALLLALSFFVRQRKTRPENLTTVDAGAATGSMSGAVDEVEDRVIVPTVTGDRTVPEPVQVAFNQFTSDLRAKPPLAEQGAIQGERPPIVLIHGSPGHKQDFARLGPMLATEGRVIAPDLPGFGGSTRAIPDYSFRAHARYMLELLDRLGIRRAHLVGYSMGGGVVLNMIDIAPERVASLTLLSAIGVQEMELTGSYYLNHLVHGVQLGGLLLLREATPHMGTLDATMLDVPYARNFYDSDQRPLRAILQRVDVPTLVLHGEHDPLVPVEAAREHHRLVAQSELVILPSNHFMPFAQPGLLAPPMIDFIARVNTGRGVTRAQAGGPAIEAARRPLTRASLPMLRGIAAFVTAAVVAGCAAILPEFGAVAGGVLVGEGRLGVSAVLIALVAGLLSRRIVAAGFSWIRVMLSANFAARETVAADGRSARAFGWRAVSRTAWMVVLVSASAAATNWWGRWAGQ